MKSARPYLTLVLTVIVARPALAQDPTESQVIPYTGHLQLDGTPVDGPIDLTFELYDDYDPGDGGVGLLVWTETQSVTVINGEFSVMLGVTTDLGPVQNIPELFVAVILETGGPIALSGRQRLGTVPFAWGGAPGRSFTTDGRVRGGTLQFRRCNGMRYQCNPRDCIQLCASFGERIASLQEVFNFAASERNHCAYVWMTHDDNLGGPCRGFPMYSNQTTTSCGPAGTGNIPRINGHSHAYNWWDTSAPADCACSTLR